VSDLAPDKRRPKARYKSAILAVVHEGISDLYESGLVDVTTMRRFDASCLTPIEEFGPAEVKALRKREHTSQAVLAEHLGVTTSTVSQWERGLRTPDGSAAKLLTLIKTKGLSYIR